MDSMPPVTTTSWLPARTMRSAISTARMDEAQTLLIVSAGTSLGIPAAIAAWRAGACPAPAWRTWPMIAYSTSPGSIPARSSPARIAIAPSSVAGCLPSPPPRRPNGVRTAETMTDRVTGASVAPAMRARAALSVCGADLHEHLPEVLAAEQPDERARGVLDALDDGLAVGESAFANPLGRLLDEGREVLEVVADDVALHAEPLRHDHEHVARPRRRLHVVVAGDRAAGDDTAVVPHGADRRFEVVAADVVEVHVDPIRGELAERRAHGPGAGVERP